MNKMLENFHYLLNLMRKKNITIDTGVLVGLKAKMKVRTTPTGMQVADISFQKENKE